MSLVTAGCGVRRRRRLGGRTLRRRLPGREHADVVDDDELGARDLRDRLDHGVEGAVQAPSITAHLDVPTAVASALAEELTLLTDRAYLVLRGAAVVGNPSTRELAACAAGVADSVSLAAADELLSYGVILQTDGPRRFRFRHPLVRRAGYESGPGG
jgi:hypothetical protein